MTKVKGKDQLFCGDQSMELPENCYQFMLSGNQNLSLL